ncbi:MAG TPA: hypothetical protein VGH20_07005 [Myxococcales bacterium]|jgi:hypothetical protein
MPSGFFVTLKTREPVLYFAGIIVFLVVGVALAGLSFAGVIGGGAGLGVIGLVVALGAAALLVEYMATR